jgi:hypothetical protein
MRRGDVTQDVVSGFRAWKRNLRACRNAGKRPDYYSLVRAWVLVFIAACATALHAQGRVDPVAVRRTGTLGAAGIRESSGVAVSRAYPGVLWTHNDSDDRPVVYAIDTTGALIATFDVAGASAVDWEDIALGPCPTRWKGRTCLVIGDIGDNLERRTTVTLYAFPEPNPRAAVSGRRATEPALGLRVSYEDGPRDAEALALLPDARTEILTKGRSGPIVRYEIPADRWTAGDVTLTPLDTLPIRPQLMLGRWVTGAATTPDGTRAVVRTFTELYFFQPGRHWEPIGAPCWLGLTEPQGEGVDFLDSARLVLTSEKGMASEGVITIVRCP